MSFDNVHPNRKDWRKPYWPKKNNWERAKECRNNKSCSYCRNARLYNRRKTKEAADIHLKLWKLGKL